MFSEEKFELHFFIILTSDLLHKGTHRPQIVIKIPMVLVLGVILRFILPFPVNYLYLQFDL